MFLKFVRLLRKKIILALIFSLSLIYCLYSFTKDGPQFIVEKSTSELNGVKMLPEINSFQWNPDAENSTIMATCRSSVQGKFLIADDQGYVCRRAEVLANGCCNSNSTFTNRYICDSCFDDGCCTIYEHCLSCCMHPNKKPILENIFVMFSSTFHFILSAVKDQFELCSAKCRTNSQSVQHENLYRNPNRKYCYKQISSDSVGT